MSDKKKSSNENKTSVNNSPEIKHKYKSSKSSNIHKFDYNSNPKRHLKSILKKKLKEETYEYYKPLTESQKKFRRRAHRLNKSSKKEILKKEINRGIQEKLEKQSLQSMGSNRSSRNTVFVGKNKVVIKIVVDNMRDSGVSESRIKALKIKNQIKKRNLRNRKGSSYGKKTKNGLIQSVLEEEKLLNEIKRNRKNRNSRRLQEEENGVKRSRVMSCHDVMEQNGTQNNNTQDQNDKMNTSNMELNKRESQEEMPRRRVNSTGQTSLFESPIALNRSLQHDDLNPKQKILKSHFSKSQHALSQISQESQELSHSDLTEKKKIQKSNDNTLNLDIILQPENSNNKILVYESQSAGEIGEMDEILTQKEGRSNSPNRIINQEFNNNSKTQKIIINVNNHQRTPNKSGFKESMISSGNNTIKEVFEGQSRTNSVWNSFQIGNSSFNHRLSDFKDSTLNNFPKKNFEKKVFQENLVVKEENEKGSDLVETPDIIKTIENSEDDFFVATDGSLIFSIFVL